MKRNNIHTNNGISRKHNRVNNENIGFDINKLCDFENDSYSHDLSKRDFLVFSKNDNINFCEDMVNKGSITIYSGYGISPYDIYNDD